MTPILAGPARDGLLPITLKALAYLKKYYVDSKAPGENSTLLGDLFRSKDVDTSIREELTKVTSFFELVAAVQSNALLAAATKQLSDEYWYSGDYDLMSGPVTVGRFKSLLVNLIQGPGVCWRMKGYALTASEADDVIRVMEFDGNDLVQGMRDLDYSMVLRMITL